MVTRYVSGQVGAPKPLPRSDTIFGQYQPQLADSRSGRPPIRQATIFSPYDNDNDSPAGPGVQVKQLSSTRNLDFNVRDDIDSGPKGSYRSRKFGFFSGGDDSDGDTVIRPAGDNRLRITDLQRTKKFGRGLAGEIDTLYDSDSDSDNNGCSSCPPNRPCICPSPAPMRKSSTTGDCCCPSNRPCTCPFSGIVDRISRPSANPSMSGVMSSDIKACIIRPCIELLRRGLTEANQAVLDHAKETKFSSEVVSLQMMLSFTVSKIVLQEVRGAPLLVVHCDKAPSDKDLKNCPASDKWRPLGVENKVAYVKQSILTETFAIFVQFKETIVR